MLIGEVLETMRQIKALEKKLEELKAKLLEEMIRSGTPSVEHPNGVAFIMNRPPQYRVEDVEKVLAGIWDIGIEFWKKAGISPFQIRTLLRYPHIFRLLMEEGAIKVVSPSRKILSVRLKDAS